MYIFGSVNELGLLLCNSHAMSGHYSVPPSLYHTKHTRTDPTPPEPPQHFTTHNPAHNSNQYYHHSHPPSYSFPPTQIYQHHHLGQPSVLQPTNPHPQIHPFPHPHSYQNFNFDNQNQQIHYSHPSGFFSAGTNIHHQHLSHQLPSTVQPFQPSYQANNPSIMSQPPSRQPPSGNAQPDPARNPNWIPPTAPVPSNEPFQGHDPSSIHPPMANYPVGAQPDQWAYAPWQTGPPNTHQGVIPPGPLGQQTGAHPQPFSHGRLKVFQGFEMSIDQTADLM